MVYGTVVVDINTMNESLARLDDTIARLEAATNNNTNSIRQLHIAMNDLQQLWVYENIFYYISCSVWLVWR